MEYIALLRGINVGGHQLKMDRLRRLLSEIGLNNVRTYIQSGNVFFESDAKDRQKLTEQIERHLETELGYPVSVFLYTAEEIEQLLALNPFKDRKITDDMRLCLVFTKDKLPTDLELPLLSPKKDMELVYVTDHAAFTIWYILNGRPPGATSNLDKILGKQTTTRFFHTTAKILEAAKKTTA